MDISGLGTAADKLASVIRDTAGIIIDPVKKIVISEADLFIEKRKAIKQLEIDKINLTNRVSVRILETEIRRQINLEGIVQLTLDNIDSNSEPENINRDWLNYFMSTAQDVSEEELKILWSKILANECNKSESFSKMTLDRLKIMSSKDCIIFENLCSRVLETKNNSIIIKVVNKPIFKDAYDFEFRDFIHLCDLGLLNDSEIAYIKILAGTNLEVKFPNGISRVIANNTNEDIQIEFYLLTTAGKELKKILKTEVHSVYFNNLIESLNQKGLNLTIFNNYDDQQLRSNNSFLHDNVD